jgi:hypothetical protein
MKEKIKKEEFGSEKIKDGREKTLLYQAKISSVI